MSLFEHLTTLTSNIHNYKHYICENGAMKLFYSHETNVEKAYIITMLRNELSMRHSEECQASCHSVGQDYEVWEAFDGDTNPIGLPQHSLRNDFIHMLKIRNHRLTRAEVACTLSHASLWMHCARIDQPIVILEHDAIMVKKFTTMHSFNSLVWLGSQEWLDKGWQHNAIPPHGTMGPNYSFMLRAHAYALDPTMAKNLVANLIRHGICESADVMLRSDLFNITHQGFYAYNKQFNDVQRDTTIWPRNGTTQHRGLNINLEW